jgi:hypothetical protein
VCVCVCVCVLLGTKPRASHMLGNCATTKSHLQPPSFPIMGISLYIFQLILLCLIVLLVMLPPELLQVASSSKLCCSLEFLTFLVPHFLVSLGLGSQSIFSLCCSYQILLSRFPISLIPIYLSTPLPLSLTEESIFLYSR